MNCVSKKVMVAAACIGCAVVPAVFGAEGDPVRVAGKAQIPVLGRFPEKGRSVLRSVEGVAGSASLAGAGSTSFTIVQLSPSQDFALARKAGSADAYLLDFRGDAVREIALPVSGVDRAAVSPLGQSAVLYSAESQHAYVLKGLPDAPSVAAEMDWTGLPAVGALAIGDSGEAVLVAAGSSPATLYSVRAGSAPGAILRASSIDMLAFFRGSSDAVAISAKENRLIRVRDVGASASVSFLAGAAAGVLAPTAVAPVDSGEAVLVANAAGTLLRVPVDGSAIETAECGCSPVALHRLRGPDTYLLTDSPDRPLRVLQLNGKTWTFSAVEMNASSVQETIQ